MPRRWENAIAYLKADLTGGPEDGRVVRLSPADMPVLRPFVAGLVVSYVVDVGTMAEGGSSYDTKSLPTTKFGVGGDRLTPPSDASRKRPKSFRSVLTPNPHVQFSP